MSEAAPLSLRVGALRLQTPYLNGLAGRNVQAAPPGVIPERLATLRITMGNWSEVGEVGSAAWTATNHVDSARATAALRWR
jgi:hypothetical protein